MTRRLLLSAGGGATLVLLTSSIARSDDPVTSSVRFNREIVRIFDRKCISCHAPDGIAMSLATYREVRPWARAIREELVEQRMPPTSAARGYARLRDDIALTPRELATILTWVDGGVPRGDDSDLPPTPGAVADPDPDHQITLPDQQVPGAGEDIMRLVTVDAGLTEDRWVRQLQIRPGSRRLVRAAFVSIVAPGGSPVWAGAWTPWQSAVVRAEPAAFRVPRGSRLSIEVHYRGQEAPAIDRSSVGLFFAPEGPRRELTSLVLAPSGQLPPSATSARAVAPVPRDVMLMGGRLAAALDGVSVEVTARTPDGHVDVLVWIPKLRSEWPAPFIFQEPVRLPGGTVLSVITTGTGASRVRTTFTLHSTD